MLFLETWFWIFAAIAVAGYWVCPRPAKLYWLIAASATFHWHFAGPAGVIPIVVLGIVTYAVGLLLATSKPRRVFALACITLASTLAFYKYSEFALTGSSDLSVWFGWTELAASMSSWSAPVAPLAISFFTFEFVHYLYEVRVTGRDPIRNPFHFIVFAIFFPTLASGPIKRFPDFVPQLSELSNPSVSLVGAGARRVIRGLFKKVCIADILVEYIVVLEDVGEFNPVLLTALAVMQGFRIYYDFAGYTDIAIGLAQMLNLRVPENFDRPYFSTSLADFWRRWHMSLSSWIRDYIYIPLGGNRSRRAFNLLLAMALCGLWHGAAWNFVAWGVYHGTGLGLEAIVRNRWPVLFEDGRAATALRWLVCYSFVTYGWLLFFYPLATVARMTQEAISWVFA